jgi:hypothetical protein
VIAIAAVSVDVRQPEQDSGVSEPSDPIVNAVISPLPALAV